MDILRRTSPRDFGLGSLALLAACAAVPGAFPLGGAAQGSAAGRGLALALGLLLGWGVPGLPLALLSGVRGDGPRLLGRALGLGFGWIFATGLAHAVLFGRAPGRGAWLVLLAVPCAVLALRSGRSKEAAAPALAPAAAAFLAMIVLAGWLWPHLHDAPFDGDGVEVHELARSLDGHRLPYWDLESPAPGGRFGHPAVVPFWTGAYLTHAAMAVLGKGELAARLPFVSSLVLAVFLALGLARSPGRAAWAYAAAAAALLAAFLAGSHDLASPGALDALTIAVWLSGFRELVEGEPRLGAGFLLLAAGVTYAAPVLSVLALAFLFLNDPRRARAALGPAAAAAALALAAVVLVGAATGSWPEWLRQIRMEYVDDYVRAADRAPLLRTPLYFLLATGLLPLAIPFAWKRLDAVERTLALTGAGYLAIILGGSVQSFHYIFPLPWILCAPALRAAADRAQLVSAVLLAAAVALLWRDVPPPVRGSVELGRAACAPEKDYETAVLAADGLLPGGRHVFVRYALELGSCPGEGAR